MGLGPYGHPSAEHALALPPDLLDSYTRPEDGRSARTYRFTYSSDRAALCRQRALEPLA